VLTPATFAADTVSVPPDIALRAVQMMAARYSAPPANVSDILDKLFERFDMTEAVELIRAIAE
jgi:hypothetical protein